jgi:hypothetical protein
MAATGEKPMAVDIPRSEARHVSARIEGPIGQP